MSCASRWEPRPTASWPNGRHARKILIDLAARRDDEAYEQLRHLFDPAHASYHATVGGWAISDFAYAVALI